MTEEEIELLQEIGYAGSVPVTGAHAGKSGVTRYDRTAAYDGVNFFHSFEDYWAKLMTMDGREIHRWASDEKGPTWSRFHERLPSFVPSYLNGWAHAELAEDGDLLVIGAYHMLLRLDWDSNVVWRLDLPAHHDLSVADNGDICVLTTVIATREVDGESVSFLDNQIVFVTADGEILRTLSVFEALAYDPWLEALDRTLTAVKRVQVRSLEMQRKAAGDLTPEREEYIRLIASAFRGETEEDGDLKAVLFQNNPEDLFHVNSIQILPRDNPGLWRKGDLLIVIPVIEIIAVIDHESGQAVWTWGSTSWNGRTTRRSNPTAIS